MNGRGVESYETRNLIAPWVGRGGGYPEIEFGAPVGDITMHGWARETEARRTPQLATVQGRSLRGYATRYSKAFVNGGRFCVFQKGCFARSLCDSTPIRFLVEHRESELIATTADRLELCPDDEGLAFHLSLEDDDSSRRVADMVNSGLKTGMSMGFRVEHYEDAQIAGENVRIIKDATLNEISLVGAGAVKQAHCSLIQHDSARPLKEDIDRGTLVRSGAAAQLDRAMQQMRDGLYEAFGG
jgi:HK97 family phage prohead protease